jgi:peptidoglycan/LPS O-acetylase OafA/YrhL
MDDQARKQAIGRIWAKRAFRIHATIWLLVSVVLVALWAMSDQEYFWPVWPIGGWAIGVVAHFWATYGISRPITEEQIQREMDRIGSRPQPEAPASTPEQL